MTALPLGNGLIKRRGKDTAILNFGTLLETAIAVADTIDASVADMRFIKPIDEELIRELALQHDLLVTVEENSVAGGAGSAVAEFLAAQGIVVPILQLGLPDKLIDHASHQQQLTAVGLDVTGIQTAIEERLQLLALPKQARR
jgi:1-deoxy-D-xylulose-5-phosphate synthase